MSMALFGLSAFDPADVVAVVRKPPQDGEGGDTVTVYLRSAHPIELTGDDARAWIEWIEKLPRSSEPIGTRLAVSVTGSHERQGPRRKESR